MHPKSILNIMKVQNQAMVTRGYQVQVFENFFWAPLHWKNSKSWKVHQRTSSKVYLNVWVIKWEAWRFKYPKAMFTNILFKACILNFFLGRFDISLPQGHCEHCNEYVRPTIRSVIAGGFWPSSPVLKQGLCSAIIIAIFICHFVTCTNTITYK